MLAVLFAGLARYKLAAEILVFGALAAAVLWGAHEFLEHERDIGRNEIRAEWQAQQLKDEQAARAREAQFATQLQEANAHATEREQTIRTLAAAAGRSSDSLRGTIDAIGNQLSGATVDAIRATARTYGQLLAACDGQQRSMAEDAERLNSEKRQLIEAWPRADSTKPTP